MPEPLFMSRRRRPLPDVHSDDPVTGIVGLVDVVLLLAVGFFVAALSGFGLADLLGGGDLTLVKDPGGPAMEVVQRKDGRIRRLPNVRREALSGVPIATVYRLYDGGLAWVPEMPAAAPPLQAADSALDPGRRVVPSIATTAR